MSQRKQQFPPLEFVTDGAQLVVGSLSQASDKGYKGAQRETPQYFFGLAVPKTAPGAYKLLTDIQNHALQSYSSMGQAGQEALSRMQACPIGSTPAPHTQAPFAWKIEDGDAPENVNKPGWAGCWIFKFTTIYALRVCDAENRQIDPATVKLGWYAQVAGNAVINGQTDHTAGIHLNPGYIRIVGYGQEIVPGPSAESVFGNVPVSLPPGASATPVAPGTAMPGQPPQMNPGAPQQPQYAPPPAQAPQQPQYTQPQQQGVPGFQQPQIGPNSVPTAAHSQPTGVVMGTGYAAGASYPSSPAQQPQAGQYTPPPAQAPQQQYVPPQQQPAGNYIPAPSQGAPAPGGPGAGAYAQPSYSGTAAPSNGQPQPAPATGPGQLPPGVQPHPAFLQGGGQQ